MEGPLSKWTNVVKGWQYRWFVLNMDAGLLNYYTSKEKMKRGERRGCVKLRDAQVGIDDEDDSTFTITVDHKTFHFQARDGDERKQWLEALQTCRDMHNPTYQLPGLIPKDTCMSEFDRKIAEADVYLQMLLEQQQKLDDRLAQTSPIASELRETLRIRIRNVSELVKQTIVCLQHARKNALDPLFTPFFPVHHGFNSICGDLISHVRIGSRVPNHHNQSFNGFKATSGLSPHPPSLRSTKYTQSGASLPQRMTGDSLTITHRCQSATTLTGNLNKISNTVDEWHQPPAPIQTSITPQIENRVNKSSTHGTLCPAHRHVDAKRSESTSDDDAISKRGTSSGFRENTSASPTRLLPAHSFTSLVDVEGVKKKNISVHPASPDHFVPEVSYSSSEDEFFDTSEFPYNAPPKPCPEEESQCDVSKDSEETMHVKEEEDETEEASTCVQLEVNEVEANGYEENEADVVKEHEKENNNSGKTQDLNTSVLCSGSNDNQSNQFPLDELYDQVDEEDLGNVQQHGSVIVYLISQLRIGMDLTKITLPTFILEKRSTLEMYADFLAHADLWANISDGITPQDRMIACLRWYLSAFHAGRRSSVAKKPYNPILGEMFRCFWNLPKSDNSGKSQPTKNPSPSSTSHSSTQDDTRPIPWAPVDAVVFVAEQVSHHPPISAFYAEHPEKGMMVTGSIWTKSKFLGLSLCVEMVGETVITLLHHNEEYTLCFPCGYGRNILNVPWIELGGKVTINCAKTGYYANIEFRTKPFYGGKKDQIRAECFSPQDKKSFLVVEGEWNDKMFARWADGRNQLFIDTKRMPVLQKRTLPRSRQASNESRRLWESVTQNLKSHNIEAATNAKQLLEQRQRDEAKYRHEHGITWETKCFHNENQRWIFNEPLSKRVTKSDT